MWCLLPSTFRRANSGFVKNVTLGNKFVAISVTQTHHLLHLFMKNDILRKTVHPEDYGLQSIIIINIYD